MMSTRMSQTEKETFLAGLHVGVLSMNQPDRAPLTVPIWYNYQPGGSVTVITGSNSRKGALLENGAQVGLAAQEESLPYKYVSIEGTVASVAPATAEELSSMAIRYLGEEMGQQYAQSNSIEGQVTVTITPTRWLAVDYGKVS